MRKTSNPISALGFTFMETPMQWWDSKGYIIASIDKSVDHSKLWHFRQQPARFSNNQSKRFWSSSHHDSQTAGPASVVLHSICASLCIHMRETTSSSVCCERCPWASECLLPSTSHQDWQQLLCVQISEFLRCPFYNLSSQFVTDSLVFFCLFELEKSWCPASQGYC